MPRLRDARRPRGRRTACLVVGAALIAASCGGGGDGGPLVDRIDDAMTAVEAYYGEPQQFVEVSATATVVSLIVAREGTAEVEQAFWSPDDGLVDPVPLGPMDRPSFPADAVAFDPDAVLDQVRVELPDAEISDFAVTGSGAGSVIYDARVTGAQGGVLLVLLGPDGRILGVQAE